MIDAAVKAMNWEDTCIAFQMKLSRSELIMQQNRAAWKLRTGHQFWLEEVMEGLKGTAQGYSKERSWKGDSSQTYFLLLNICLPSIISWASTTLQVNIWTSQITLNSILFCMLPTKTFAFNIPTFFMVSRNLLNNTLCCSVGKKLCSSTYFKNTTSA